MMEAILEVSGLTKTFGGKPVLRGIDLAIQRGRVVGLLGRNGAGKSTLLKCALDLMRPTAGRATLFGEDSRRLSPETKARIGYVPQKLEFQSFMRVRQLIAYHGAFYPRWNRELAASLVSRWGLDGEALVSSLSEGQLQKLGLILAIGSEPELLILDEPAASLDPEARRTFLAAVIDIATNPDRSVALSTHRTSDLERVATDIVILKDGVICYSGAMDDLKESVKSLALTSEKRLPSHLDVPGVLAFEARGNHALVTARNVTPALLTRLRQDYSANIEVRDLTLEDIFVEMHRV
jgi:ABC-2 type transport system ATP-binding protein